MAMPGDNLEVDVELIYPTAMNPGMTFTIREGGRTVGAGRITSVEVRSSTAHSAQCTGCAILCYVQLYTR